MRSLPRHEEPFGDSSFCAGFASARAISLTDPPESTLPNPHCHTDYLMSPVAGCQSASARASVPYVTLRPPSCVGPFSLPSSVFDLRSPGSDHYSRFQHPRGNSIITRLVYWNPFEVRFLKSGSYMVRARSEPGKGPVGTGSEQLLL